MKVQQTSWSGFWRVLEINGLDLASLALENMSFKSLFWAKEDAGGSCLGFGILILIWIWSLVFDTTMIKICVLYLDFKGAKNLHVL